MTFLGPARVETRRINTYVRTIVDHGVYGRKKELRYTKGVFMADVHHFGTLESYYIYIYIYVFIYIVYNYGK